MIRLLPFDPGPIRDNGYDCAWVRGDSESERVPLGQPWDRASCVCSGSATQY
ncbi:hypothetical protein HSR121_2255 [Halapricum desulfuricans]|uniref:Uncharacterized protein n=1 Tax=Halapricum desulfuricans TaxID=2841257 RepID=A0A897N1N1_9EURY|nr:hypothetical protein HSR121_2255 [Halapricum desulfuricans]